MRGCMRAAHVTIAALLAGVMPAFGNDVGTDPAHNYAWGENVGWGNAGPTNHDYA